MHKYNCLNYFLELLINKKMQKSIPAKSLERRQGLTKKLSNE